LSQSGFELKITLFDFARELFDGLFPEFFAAECSRMNGNLPEFFLRFGKICRLGKCLFCDKAARSVAVDR
jgi:hypothetical protein